MISTTALVLLSMAQCPGGQCPRPVQVVVEPAKKTVSVLVNPEFRITKTQCASGQCERPARKARRWRFFR